MQCDLSTHSGSNVDGLALPEDNNVAPVPVVYPENGIQHSMAAAQYLEKLKVAYTPAHMQQVGTQSQKNFPGLHQQVSQENTESTGFQYPKSRHSAHCPWNSHHQMSRKAKADLYSSAHVAQCSSYFGISDSEKSGRHSVRSGGQEMESSKEKGSNLNINDGLQPRQHLNFALSVGTSSSAPLGGGLQVPTRSLPSLDGSYSTSKAKQHIPCPLLVSLPTGNPVDLKFPSLSQETNNETEKNTTIPFPHERPYSNQQMERSVVALGRTTHKLQFSEGRKQHISSPCPSNPLFIESISPVGEMMQSTGDYIQDFIIEQVAYFRRTLTQNDINNGRTNSNKGSDFCANEKDPTLQSDSIMPLSNSAAHLPTTFRSYKEDMERKSLISAVSGCNTAVGQAHEMDSAKLIKANAELTPKSKKTRGCTTSTSKEYCTEYPQLMMKVAAACTKNEDESPVVLNAVPRAAMDELTQKHPSQLFKYSSSQEEYKSLKLKPVEGVGLDGVQGVTNVSEEFQTKSNSGVSDTKMFEPTSLTENQEKKNENVVRCNVTCKEEIAHSKTNSSTNIQIHNVISVSMNQYEWLCNQASCEGVKEDVCSVPLQSDAKLTISENKVKEEALLFESQGKELLPVKIIKAPQYEDISDDEDMSQLAIKIPNPEHGELNFPECLQDMHYEDISENENRQFESMATDTHSPAQVPEPNKQQTETPDLEQCCSDFSKTDDGCHLRRQTEHSVYCIPSSVLTDDDTDEQMDDDWLVIPLTVANLKFELDDEHQNSPEKAVLKKETQCDVSPAHNELHSPARSPSYQIDVYDTTESCLRAMRLEFMKTAEVAEFLCPPEYLLDSEGTPQTPQNSGESNSDSEDSCETEDSCDYPYLTETRQLSWKRSVPLPTQTDDYVSGKGREDEVTEALNDQNRCLDTLGCTQKQRQHINTKTADNHVKHKTYRQENKRLFSSDSDKSGDAPCSPQKRHSPGDSQAPLHDMDLYGTAKKKLKKPNLSSEESTTKQLQCVIMEADSSCLGGLECFGEESKIHMYGNFEIQTPRTPAETNKNSDSCKKHLHRKRKERHRPISKPADDRCHSTSNIVQAKAAKSRLNSRPLSLPNQEGPSTSISNLSARSGQPSEARQSFPSSRGMFQSGRTSASCRVPKSKQSIFAPIQHLTSSNQQLSRSYSSPSTLYHPCSSTNGSSSATMQSSAREQVIKDWQNSFFPTRRDRKSNLQMDEDLRTTTSDSCIERRPGLSHCDKIPRQRHNFRESERPLMKRTKSDAIQWTKARNRDTSVKERYSVGVGYKWSEKLSVAKSAKGSHL